MAYKTEVLQKVYLLLGLNESGQVGDAKAEIIEFVYDIVADEVLNYCHLEELPAGLKNVVASMVVDLYRLGDFGRESLSRVPTNIKRGDVSISYERNNERSSGYHRNAAYILANTALMKDYYKQLNAFRKVAW